jgi:uncharacterized protein (TIGR02996 family)
MNAEATLLHALHANPADETAWLALADCLEEQGETDRAELVRLTHLLRWAPEGPERTTQEERLRTLLAADVRPCVPLLTNSLGMRLALIPPGRFWMGSLPGEGDRSVSEGPRHEVEITRAFYLGVTPVTQEQFESVMGVNPSWFSSTGETERSVRSLDTRTFPVDNVSWEDARQFCRLLSALPAEKRAGRVYRLPTEAEWEYACRAGTSTPFHFGFSLTSHEANIDGGFPWPRSLPRGPYLQRTTSVGSYRPNAFGLYDMHGNVRDWCADWFAEDYYTQSPRQDPRGARSGTSRALRGGSWHSLGEFCRSAYRGRGDIEGSDDTNGFRVALTVAVRVVEP